MEEHFRHRSWGQNVTEDPWRGQRGARVCRKEGGGMQRSGGDGGGGGCTDCQGQLRRWRTSCTFITQDTLHGQERQTETDEGRIRSGVPRLLSDTVQICSYELVEKEEGQGPESSDAHQLW